MAAETETNAREQTQALLNDRAAALPGTGLARWPTTGLGSVSARPRRCDTSAARFASSSPRGWPLPAQSRPVVGRPRRSLQEGIPWPVRLPVPHAVGGK
jgi:hypothetical protein